jgi:hypothetical protein
MCWVLKLLGRQLNFALLGLVWLVQFHWLHLPLVELFLRLGERPLELARVHRRHLGAGLELAQIRVLVQQILQIRLVYGLRPGRHERL